jgi:hypothetical protein
MSKGEEARSEKKCKAKREFSHFAHKMSKLTYERADRVTEISSNRLDPSETLRLSGQEILFLETFVPF